MRLRTLQALMMQFIRAGGVPSPELLESVAASHPEAIERLGVYRTLSRSTQIRALESVYPVTKALLGESLFYALANDYLDLYGSQSGNLHDLGREFCGIVEREPACEPYPYVSELARFETLIHQASLSQDLRRELIDQQKREDGPYPELTGLCARDVYKEEFNWPVYEIWHAHQPDSWRSLDAISVDFGKRWLAVFRRDREVVLLKLSEAAFHDLVHADSNTPISAILGSYPQSL